MIDRKQLSDDHTELGAIARKLREQVEKREPEFEAMTRERWRLGYRLAIHLATEDKHVYPALKQHADPKIAALATAYESEMGGLDQRYRDYLAKWNAVEILAHWEDFCAETLTILEALDNRIAREEQELYPMLGRAVTGSGQQHP